MYNGQQPIFIMKEGTQRTSGRTAQSNNIAAAKAVADAVRSPLGPKGMDKMLVDSMGDVVITNDGATILKEMDIEHPAAKMIIEIAKTQEQHCYDGTTSKDTELDFESFSYNLWRFFRCKNCFRNTIITVV